MFKLFNGVSIELDEENRRLCKENVRLVNSMSEIFREAERLQTENHNLRGEISFLKQRNKELRQKTWYQVYEENLRLSEDLKMSDAIYTENQKLKREVEQYKTVLQSVERFIGQYSKEKKEDKTCH